MLSNDVIFYKEKKNVFSEFHYSDESFLKQLYFYRKIQQLKSIFFGIAIGKSK